MNHEKVILEKLDALDAKIRQVEPDWLREDLLLAVTNLRSDFDGFQRERSRGMSKEAAFQKLVTLAEFAHLAELWIEHISK